MRRFWPLTVLAAVAWACLARSALAQAPLVDAVPPTPMPVPVVLPPPGDPDGSLPPQRLYLTGEFLLLRPNRDGQGLAMVSSSSGGMTYSTLESLTWNVTPAFRVGARYRLAESEADLGATFAYVHARTQQTVLAPEGGWLLGTQATDRRARDAASADGDAGLSYAVLDLDAGKTTRISDSLSVRAFGGVRLASISQTLKAIYSGGSLGDASDYVNSPIRFYGAGLSAGGEANWRIHRGWGIYGRGRFGLLSGEFDSKRTELVGSALVRNESERYCTIVPVAEMGAGLSYQGERFFFRVGYEMTDWFNMVSGFGGQNSPAALTSRKRGDLTLEAVSLRLGLAF